MPYRVVSGVIGLFFFLQGLSWIIDPGAAAEALGMPLLEGIARSTQVGDFGAFFVSLGAMCLLGAIRSNAQWLQGGAMMLGSAAVIRTLAALVHGAEFATLFISIEVVMVGILLFVATRIESAKASPAS